MKESYTSIRNLIHAGCYFLFLIAIFLTHPVHGQTTNFNFTGNVQTYTVPAGVYSLKVQLYGAQGGGSEVCGGMIEDDGGRGGYAEGILAVIPGQILQVYVGGKPNTAVTYGTLPGGFNGGGTAGKYGGGGGGASDIRVNNTSLASRVIVAGGGGGGNTGCPNHGAGGAGGGLVGVAGQTHSGAVPAQGGSQSAGGVGGTNGLAGSLGQGGQGNNYHFAGGGGGYYGGGSAYAAGGGGGSSYLGGVTAGVTQAGSRTGNGLVSITVNSLTYYADMDGDGYGNPAVSMQGLTAPNGYVLQGGDCNDANAAIHPAAVEVCDAVDNDCDGQVDEGVKTTFYADADADGFGDAALTVQACAAPAGYVTRAGDCNDKDTTTYPGAPEQCDGIDHNCDGIIHLDQEKPTLTAPGPVVVSADAGACGASGVVLGTPVTADNCAVGSVSNDAPATFPVGTTTVTWTVSDAAGNQTTATQSVTVNDTQAPVTTGYALTGSKSIYIPYGGSTNGWSPWTYSFQDPLPAGAVVTGVDLTYTAVDQGWGGTGVAGEMYVSGTHIGGGALQHWPQTFSISKTTSFPSYVYGGTNSLQMFFWGYPGWRAYWQGGTLTIRYEIPNPALATLTGECGVTVEKVPVAVDNCDGTIKGTTTDPLTYSQQGTHVITWTFTDSHGNVATQQQVVVIKDVTPPTIAAPVPVTVVTDAGLCGAVVTLTRPAVADNCGVASVSNDAPATFPVGTTTVTWTVTDRNEHVAKAAQKVTVQDQQAPTVITRNLTVELNASGQATITAAQVDNGSTDACGLASVVLDKTTFDCAHLGPNAVMLTVTDIHGNTATGTAVITVKDVTPPVARALPHYTVTLVNGVASVTAEALNNGSTDACGIASMAVSPASFSCEHIGANTVTLTVTDQAGNMATTTATVIVMGSVPMSSIQVVKSAGTNSNLDKHTIYLGYDDQSVVLDAMGGESGSAYAWSGNGVLSSTTSGLPEFAPTAAGVYTFTVVETNAYGCTASSSVTITVVDVRTGNKNDKIAVCHKGQLISVAPSAVQAHLAHGDQLGACGGQTPANARMAKAVDYVRELGLRAYPNPAQEKSTIEFSMVEAGSYSLALYDLKGALVQQIGAGAAASNKFLSFELDVTAYQAGVYLIRLTTDREVVTKRLVLER